MRQRIDLPLPPGSDDEVSTRYRVDASCPDFGRLGSQERILQKSTDKNGRSLAVWYVTDHIQKGKGECESMTTFYKVFLLPSLLLFRPLRSQKAVLNRKTRAGLQISGGKVKGQRGQV